MKITLDEASIADAVFFWANHKFRLEEGEYVQEVVIQRDDDGNAEVVIIIDVDQADV